MAGSPIDVYHCEMESELRARDAMEHTHRPALKDLIESLGPGVRATNEPKRVEREASDSIGIRGVAADGLWGSGSAECSRVLLSHGIPNVVNAGRLLDSTGTPTAYSIGV